jgi:hypothetical protein
MEYIIFYSWQSDLPNNLNRSFIESILEKAAKSFSKDQNYSVEPVIDRDTAGIPGSPSIVSSITEKIAKSDIFVCDISIINQQSDGRKTPNPNVLLELGYASSILGWDRIIMIQNIAFGGLELLPFDIRGRRVVDYYLDTSSINKPEVKQSFYDKMFGIFKIAFSHHYSTGNLYSNNAIWCGEWNLETLGKFNSGILFISRVSSTNFYFTISFVDGARSGELTGKAKIFAPNAAIARIKTYDDAFCEVLFRRRANTNGKWIIEIEEGKECKYFHGQGASFDGIYVLSPEPILYNAQLDELDLNEVFRITGNYYKDFIKGFQRITIQEILDDNITKVVAGGVKGMFTIVESIVGLNDKGDVWCAFIEEDFVRYFTNVATDIERLPKTFENWRSRFLDKELIYSS